MSATVKMHTPQELRRFGTMPDHIIIPITSDKGPMLADALEIADSCAAADLECRTKQVLINGKRFWDLDTASATDRSIVEKAVGYLTRRGMLERYDVISKLVRVKVAA